MITIPYSKIEKAVGPPDNGRPALANVYFDAENQRLCAADGFIAAIIPVEITTTDDQPDDKSGFIPVDAFKTGRKRAGRSRLYLDASDGIITMPFDNDGSTIQWQRPDAGYRFPDIDQIVPNYDPDDDDTVTVAFDAKLLATLAEALIQNDDNPRKAEHAHIRLTFSREKIGSPIHVTPIPDNGRVKGRVGVLMPVHDPKV